jgi:hypothetical protein
MNTVVFMTKASFSARRPFSMEQSHSHARARKARSRGSFAASLAAAAGGFAASFALIAACSHHDDGVYDCSNGTCACPGESTCAFSCAAPPCHVDCGPGSACQGTCANGECTCETGASCSFACGAPPCHVTCEGSNPRCDGTCANGTCTCAAGSACRFACASGPCHTVCPAGASCAVSCPNAGVAGTEDCDIVACAAGTPMICPDGLSIVCAAACPGDP